MTDNKEILEAIIKIQKNTQKQRSRILCNKEYLLFQI